MKRLGRLGSTAALAAALLVSAPAVAHASFTKTGTETHTLATDTLAAPTAPAVSYGTCSLVTGDQLVVTWSASASAWLDGYEVQRALAAGGPWTAVGSVGPGTTTFTDSGLAYSTTFHYRVLATKQLWRSAPSASVSKATRSALCV